MKFTRKALALSILAATASMSAQAVVVDADTRGQLLLAPVYVAGPGQSTEIRVVNPSMDVAVKAHVTFRSATNSIDLLNFILYLSPGDEWVGKVVNNNGVAQIQSNDDSMLVELIAPNGGTPTGGKFASEIEGGYKQDFFSARTKDKKEVGTMGHIEILGVYAVYDGLTAQTSGTGAAVKPLNSGRSYIHFGMSKSILFTVDNQTYNNQSFAVGSGGVNKGGLYDGYIPANAPFNTGSIGGAGAGSACNTAAGGAINAFLSFANLDGSNGTTVATTTSPLIGLTASGVLGVGTTAPAQSEAYCVDALDNRIQLTGEVILKLSENGNPFSYQMVALDDDPAGTTTAVNLDGGTAAVTVNESPISGVIMSPFFDVVAENDVPLGVRMGELGIAAAPLTGFLTDINSNQVERYGYGLTPANNAGTALATANNVVATDNIARIDMALAQSSYMGLYDSLTAGISGDGKTGGDAESVVVVGFPTKYRHVHANTLGTRGAPNNTSLMFSGAPFNTATLPAATWNDYLDDNAAVRSTADFDEDYVHYDYDYGYRQEILDALLSFDGGSNLSTIARTVYYPNHNPNVFEMTSTGATAGTGTPAAAIVNPLVGDNEHFIFGYRTDTCDTQPQGTAATATTSAAISNSVFNNTQTRMSVVYNIVSYNTSEQRYVPPVNTGVVSGDIGSGGSSAALPNETNIITDANDGLWYSIKGWYQANVGMDAAGTNVATCNRYGTMTPYQVPSIVMTATTSKQGTTRIEPAL